MNQISKSLIAAVLFVSIGQTALADEPATPPEDEGFSLMEKGAQLLFKGLMQEMEPAISGMGDALKEMEPAIQELIALIDDFRNYDAPRILENGDILIPRRPGAPPPKLKPDAEQTEPAPSEQIDL